MHLHGLQLHEFSFSFLCDTINHIGNPDLPSCEDNHTIHFRDTNEEKETHTHTQGETSDEGNSLPNIHLNIALVHDASRSAYTKAKNEGSVLLIVYPGRLTRSHDLNPDGNDQVHPNFVLCGFGIAGGALILVGLVRGRPGFAKQRHHQNSEGHELKNVFESVQEPF